jgi:hypothetical protein
MVKELRVYPEGRIFSDNNRTPIHAAAISGNNEKLQILLREIDERYFG